MAMDISFVPTLQHLSGSKVVSSLFNPVLPYTDFAYLDSPLFSNLQINVNQFREYKTFKRQIKQHISNLTPCTSLRKKLEHFILPLFTESEKCLKICSPIWILNNDASFAVKNSISQCWLTDGTINQERFTKLVLKNNNVLLIIRFIFACNYCLYEDILCMWEIMTEGEKKYLRTVSDSVVNEWIDWLKSALNKDWQFCVAWILGTPLWCKNVYVLKRVLQALAPAEKKHYLSKALVNRGVSSDVIRFGLSIITTDEQELIFKESPVKVLKCFISWSWRDSFFDFVDILMPYLDGDTYCSAIYLFLLQIKNTDTDYEHAIETVKRFWDKSPEHFQNIVKDNNRLFRTLRIALEYDFRKGFPRGKFVVSCQRAKKYFIGIDDF